MSESARAQESLDLTGSTSPLFKPPQDLENSLENISASGDYGSVQDGDRSVSTPHSCPKRQTSASSLSSTYCSDMAVVEETSLLPRRPTKQKITPLPWGQVSIILLLQVCEPLTSMSIYPYINQLVGELHIIDSVSDTDHQVGYYAGLIMSLFFVTEAVTVLHWSRLSDHVGRKPILLIGLLGATMSTLCFGLSRTYWGLVLSRCLCGLLNGNVGVMKSVMGELTDVSNRVKGLSLLPVVWATGAALGPFIGGTLARPTERFPNVFTGIFWKEYPYFLPCLATAAFVFVAFGVTLVFFKETISKSPLPSRLSPSEETRVNDQPVPFRQLLVYPVILSIGNYMNLAFLSIALEALFPLFLATPLSIGGLGFNPHIIGYIMGTNGVFTGVVQALFFPMFVRVAGVRRVFVTGMVAFMPILLLFPIMSLDAQESGVNAFTWICIATMLVLMSFLDMSFGCIFMYVTASAPNKRSLGATNGLSQTTVSVARAIGPAMATSLFAFSVEHKILRGYGVYVILFVLSCFAVYLALCLPHDVWKEAEEND